MGSCWCESFSQLRSRTFQQRRNSFEVIRQRSTPFPLFPAIADPEFLGVKELPFQSVLLAKSLIESEVAVLLVHDDGIAELGEMETDLMQPAGGNGHAHEGR